MNFAAEQRRAFANAEQPERFAIVNMRWRNSDAVVADFQNQMIIDLEKIHFHCAGFGMANDIGQRLLKDAKERGVQFGVERAVRNNCVHATNDAGLRLKLLRLPFDRRKQAGGVQHAGTQFGSDAPNRLYSFVNVCGDRPRFLSQNGGVFWQPTGEPGELQFQTGQSLAEFIVNFAGDARAFLFANRLQVHGKQSQLFVGLA